MMIRVNKETIISLVEEDGVFHLGETMFYYFVEAKINDCWQKIGNQYGAHKFPTKEEAERYLDKISIVLG